MIYLLLDADEYLVSRRIAALKAAMGDAEMADLNVHEVEGPSTSVPDLLGQAGALPFLSTRRLLIARDYLGHLEKRMAASQSTQSAAYADAASLLAGFASLPESTDILFVEKSLNKSRHLWRGFRRDEGHTPGIKERIEGKEIQLEELNTPDPRQLPGWITRAAKESNIAIDGRAVQLLAAFVGPNLRQIENELAKLAAYADDRPIGPDDVRLLVSDASEALIWDLTDAMSTRSGKRAMKALHELRQGDAHPFYLLTMIARQYRILIKVKEAMERGETSPDRIAKQIGERPYPVKKALGPARTYPMGELESILDRILETDHAMKSGADPDTEIDILVADFCRPGVTQR